MCTCTINKNIPTNMNMMFLDPSKALAIEKKSSNAGSAYDLELPPLNVTGYVTDIFGNPLSDAHVYLDSSFGTFTNEKGFFSLDEVPHGELLTISHQGYTTELREVFENMGKIGLELEADDLDAVYITATTKPAVKAPEVEPFPWVKLLTGVTISVVSAVVINKLTSRNTFKGAA